MNQINPQEAPHVCAFHRILDGSCVVCGQVDEAIKAANTDAPQEPAQADCGMTHYAGCACHERGWKNKWRAAVEMAAQAQAERDEARKIADGLCQTVNAALAFVPNPSVISLPWHPENQTPV